jgi:DivIVA domain-containing protein
MELTPDLFAEVEFTERRKGYDTEEVDSFLEEAGTDLAQVLARVRHTEERAAHAESRLSEAEQKLRQAEEVLAEADRRVQLAEQRLQQAAHEAQHAAPARLTEEAEVEQAAKTLLMARKTADATVNEAKGQAQSLLEEARARVERQIHEANAEAEELLRRAAAQAESEFADRRAEAMAEVQGLESRRAQLTDVINQLESRLAGYRADLSQTADELLALVQDPSRLGARPNISIQADEVLPSSEQREADHPPDADDEGAAASPVAEAEDELVDEIEGEIDQGGSESAETTVGTQAPGGAGDEPGPFDEASIVVTDPDPVAADPVAAEPVATEPIEAHARTGGVPTAAFGHGGNGHFDLYGDDATTVDRDAGADGDDEGERTQYLDLTAGSPTPDKVAETDRWGPGSWSDLEPELEPEPASAVPRRDRFMEELDSAVNEAVELDDDAMTAFFEGTSDSRARRFGWRR